MRIKLDENHPESLVPTLGALGHDVDNVRLEGLAGRDDPAVWRAAPENGRFLISQDLDFSDLERFTPGTHYGLALIRMRSPGRSALAQRLVAILPKRGSGGVGALFCIGHGSQDKSTSTLALI